MASQEKITVYNLADLKNTSDDALTNYLTSLKFTQTHRLTDVRLALGYSAFALSAACFAWDYKFGFEQTKYCTAVAVAIYTILNSFLTFWIFYVEKGTVYEGTSPSGQTAIKVSTSTNKNDPVYRVTVEVKDKKSGKKEVIKLEKEFREWFDVAGRFVAVPFQSVLATGVPAIGEVDTKRVQGAAESKKNETVTAAYTPELLEALANAGVVGSAGESASGTDAKKGGKRRKA
ncbi:microsomal signal peptidase 25 kDa subunit-domain-containing protein [Podospora fimiseda]|uniref:Signal peptidase complex subunit 2 n=1 Tax=Podospora fimiseda TaxID=252190 RepID=A0AAN7H745_9PEZI|nr:microsomal signal peptidase 25 kDa subunit-domain-containing protein [Podospora fimiseda]